MTSRMTAVGRLGVLPVVLLVSCAARVPVPMRSVADLLAGGAPAKCLVVFLPGAGDHAEHFAREGFVSALREKRLSVDIIAADATMPYYFSGSFLTRLETDVLAPARAKGYAETWLIGNSMGGHGSLLYPSRRPGQVTGVFALAPWLGSAAITDELRQRGGLEAWDPSQSEIPSEAFERQLWEWLRDVTVKGEAGPEIWLGYGSADRLAKDDAVLAAALPPERTFHSAGAHNWKTWRGLLEQFLERSSFAMRCAP